MKRLLLALVAVLVLLVAAAVLAPSFIDWNQYKTEIAAQVEKFTGRRLTIDGAVSFAVLPTPRLSVDGLHLANPSGAAQADLLTLQTLQIRVALLPLLSGRIKVESLRLVRPVIDLEILPDGRQTWDFAPRPAANPNAGVGGGAGPGLDSAGGLAEKADVSLQSVVIENGTLLYRDAVGGRTERLDGINTSFGAASLAGPFTAEGDFALRGRPMSFTANVGDVSTGRPAILTVGLETSAGNGVLRYSGQFEIPAGGGIMLNGRLKGQAEDVGALAASFAIDGLPDRPLALDGLLRLDAGKLSFDDLTLQLAGSTAHGNLLAELGATPRVDVALRVNLLDLDNLLADRVQPPPASAAAPTPAIPAPAPAPPSAPPAAAPPPAAAVLTPPPGFVLPRGIDGKLDVKVEAIAWHGSVVRQAVVQGDLRDGTLTVAQAGALLPGGGQVGLDGTLTTPATGPRFTGALRASADSLRALLDWLRVDVAGVPPDRLLRAQLSAGLTLDSGRLAAQNLDLRLDSSHLTGSAALTLRSRPAISVDLALDRLNIDSYLPTPAVPSATAGQNPAGNTTGVGARGAPATPPPAAPPTQAVPPAAGELARLADFDVDAKLRIGDLTWRRVTLRDAQLAGKLADGTLVMDRLAVGDAGGAAFTLAGTAQDLAGAPHVDGTASLKANSLAALWQLAGITAPPALADLKDISVQAAVKGNADAIAFSNLKGRIDGTDIAGDLDLRRDGVRPKLTAKLALGDLDLDRYKAASSSSMPPSAAAFPAAIPPAAFDPGKAAATAQQPAASPVPAAAASRWSKQPYDLSALRLLDADLTVNARRLQVAGYDFRTPHLSLALADGNLDLRDATAQLFGGPLAVKGKLQSLPQPALTLSYVLQDADLRQMLQRMTGTDRISGRFGVQGDIAGTGQNPDALVRSLQGNARWTARDGVVRGIDVKGLSDRLNNLDSIANVVDMLGGSLSGGETKLIAGGGSFVVAHGIATTQDSQAKLEAAEATLTGTLDLPAWTMDIKTLLRLTEHADAPNVGIGFSGPIDNPQRDLKTHELEQFLLKRVGSRLLNKGKTGDLLRGLLGDGTAGAAPPASGQPSPPAQKIKPEQLLKNLLKGLGGQ